MNLKKTSSALDIAVQRIDSSTVELCWQPKDRKPTVAICSGVKTERQDAKSAC